VVGLSIIIEDVTEMVKAREELESSYEKLKEIDSMRNEFIDMASHELRSPLSAIKMYVDLMSGGKVGSFSDEEKGYLEDMDKNIRTLNRTIHSMLEYSRTKSTQIKISSEKVEIGRILESVLDEFQQTADLRKIKIRKEIEGKTGCRCDSELVRTVLVNLVGNAIKYSRDGGEVSVRISNRDGELEVSIQDRGVGIRQKDQPFIFDRFFMGDTSLTREKDSMGMGLPIAKAIVERHGGKIWAKSQEGEGSKFTFTLPLKLKK